MLSQEFVRAIHHDRQREIEEALRMRELRKTLEAARSTDAGTGRVSAAAAAPQPRHATGAGA